MKDFLKRLIQQREAEIRSIREQVQASTDAEEVRSLGGRLENANTALSEARARLADLEAEESRDNTPPAGGFNPLGTYGVRGSDEVRDEHAGTTDSMEYRTAFMNLVTRGQTIPSEVRANANTLTTDVGSEIPAMLINQIIERMTVCGMILPLVTRTSYAAGIVIPTSSVKPVASWVAEGESSDRQKKTTGKITFSYFKLRCEVSMSMEVGTMALSAFEAAFVKNVTDAMIVAIEKAILAGDGTSQPTGILTTGVGSYSDHVITTTGTAGAPTYADLIAAEAAVPVEYENTAKWFMTKANFMAFMAMVDDNGQPIARVDHGIDGRLSRTLLGRDVVLHPYGTEMGSYMAGIFDFSDYVLNTIYDMGIQRKQDWDTEDFLTKAVMSVDGKPVDNYSLVLVQAGS